MYEKQKPYISLIACWLCLFSILSWSILPALGGHVRQAGGSFLLEICTAQGIEFISLGDDFDPESDPKAPNERQLASNHCPLCSLRFAAILPENLMQNILPSLEVREVKWQFVDGVLVNNTRYLFAHPRAPPYAS